MLSSDKIFAVQGHGIEVEALMGLQSWTGDEICQKDASSPKSYLAEAEFRELNRVTIILLDIFDDQADRGKLTTMKVAEELFDRQLRLLERPVLKHGGNVFIVSDKRSLKRQRLDQFESFDHLAAVGRRRQRADGSLQPGRESVQHVNAGAGGRLSLASSLSD